MAVIGKALIGLGIALSVIGLVLVALDKLGIHRLPGDFVIRRGNFTGYFPLASCLLASAILTLILNLVFRRR